MNERERFTRAFIEQLPEPFRPSLVSVRLNQALASAYKAGWYPRTLGEQVAKQLATAQPYSVNNLLAHWVEHFLKTSKPTPTPTAVKPQPAGQRASEATRSKRRELFRQYFSGQITAQELEAAVSDLLLCDEST